MKPITIMGRVTRRVEREDLFGSVDVSLKMSLDGKTWIDLVITWEINGEVPQLGEMVEMKMRP